MGSSNAVAVWYHKTSWINWLKLKSFTIESNQDCTVIISQTTLHSYNNKAALTIDWLCELLGELNIDIANNRNIVIKHLGGKGLHLNLDVCVAMKQN